MTDAAQQEAIARIIVDRLGAGSIGMTDDASMAAALPIAEEVLALIQAPLPGDLGELCERLKLASGFARGADQIERAKLLDKAAQARRALSADNARLREERDDLRRAIFGNANYSDVLGHGNFIEMARATEDGRLGAVARAERAEAEVSRLSARKDKGAEG